MKRCPHPSPHYRANEKGQEGVFLCDACLEQPPPHDLKQVVEDVDAALKEVQKCKPKPC